jgi:uncharacterized protein YyaL (SSP411 family)
MPQLPKIRALALIFSLVLGAFPLRAQQLAPPPGDTGLESGEGRGPDYLVGVNLELPAPEAFKGWPSDALQSRAYFLPWSPLSFQRAALYGRPVLFVLTVPWNRLAQRMAAETLSDPAVLKQANQGWVTVVQRADRRPDLQERYQTGTWPVIAFLLPDGHPMLSQANDQQVARPITAGFSDAKTLAFLLDQGQIYWDRWSNVLRGVGDVWAKGEGGAEPEPGAVKEDASDQVARWMLGNADRKLGGFGAAPKFPLLGLAEYARLRDARLVPALRDHARFTLEQLVASPLHDRRDGGFHRLAAAADWGNIQYEKMLERNGQLLRELTVELRAGASAPLQDALTDTTRFLLHTLARPGGGFFLAQVADPTSPDGGRYWTVETDRGSPPPVDRLVLSGPNALAGAALLRAGAWLGDPAATAAGRGALDLVLERAYARGRGVDHVLEPRPEPRRFLVSQADVAFGLVDAYETTGEQRYLAAARDIVDFSLANLLRPGETALRDHLPEPAEIGLLANPRRPMADNARLARVMRRLAVHGQGEVYGERAASVLGSYAGNLTLYGAQAVEAAVAVEEMIREPLVVRVDGNPGTAEAAALRRAAVNLPWAWTVVTTGRTEGTPVATLSWRGDTQQVGDARGLAEAAAKLTGTAR